MAVGLATVVISATVPTAYAQSVGEIPAEGILVQANGTHVTIDWQDAEHATRYLVQIYTGTLITDSLFVTDSILVDKELTPGKQYTITATPYRGFSAGVERELATVRVDDITVPPPDTTAPVITVTGGDVTLPEGASYVEQGATCTDDRDGDLAVTTSGTVDVNTVGAYTVTYTCTDSAGNGATATRTVVVTDSDSPTIVIRGPASVEVPQGSTYTDQGAECVDNADPNPRLSTNNPVNTDNLGTYSVTYTCIDSDGNIVTANRVVIVATPDTTAPTLTLNGQPAVSVFRGSSYADAGATCTDDRDPNPTLTVTPATVDTNTLGTYTLVYTCTDASGNTAPSVVRTVVVATPDTTAPTPPGLASTLTSLISVIQELSQKIASLEMEIASQRGGQVVVVPITDEGDFIPIYRYATTGSYNEVQKQWYEDQRFLERFTDRLSQTLVLPHDVYVTMAECGASNAYYYPDYNTIAICYEYVTYLENLLYPYYATDTELFQKVDAVVTFVMLHELGHALVDVYDLPITGNEEDAVDQFAAIVTLEYVPPVEAGDILLATLTAWDAAGSDDSLFPTEGQLAGTHSLNLQRFYNLACWMYGSDVHAYSLLLNLGLLTEGRAAQCQAEYEQVSESWYRLVSPFLLNPGSIAPP